MAKVIIITGGTGGIGYQAARMLASKPEKHTIVVTGRSEASGKKAVDSLKEQTGNDNVEYAVADLSEQMSVRALGKELLSRFPVIDELINNAGNLSSGEQETTKDGINKNFAVNVIAPLLLSRELLPALRKASPTGRIQITSGGIPNDTLVLDDLDSTKLTGIAHYSHTKRIMEAMAVSVSREFAPVAVNVVGGAVAAATGMTSNISFKDMPWFMKPLYPLVKFFVFSDDGGKSATKGAEPPVWAALASPDELGTGKAWLMAPKEGKFKPEVADEENQKKVMEFIEAKLIA